MKAKLKLQFPSPGWRQILSSRTEMLNDFDRAKEQAKAHEAETFHGKVAEASFRKWLSDFLPKRYGVTSGYILSLGLKSTQKMPHFDVIIYDQLESPILWVEDSHDASGQGKSRAIPVEYVRCVVELKATFSPSEVGNALEHLGDLRPLLGGMDDLCAAQGKLYLPENFCCGAVFFNLGLKHQFSESSLTKLIDGLSLRGFFGGLILRGETYDQPLTGRLSAVRGKDAIAGTIGSKKRNGSLLNGSGVLSKSARQSDGTYLNVTLLWSKSNFAQFAFDLIAMMEGKYRPGFVSSWHGIVGTERA